MDHNDDDKHRSLHELSSSHRSSIVSQLVGIGRERNQQAHTKFRSFIRNLQCLQQTGTRLHRVSIDAFREQEYVALSYTWVPSNYEDPRSGRHFVESWNGSRFTPSTVRDCVLDRILSYMHHASIQFLWIDAHSIPQDTCSVALCNRHAYCEQKRNALQAMDLVYQLSNHPVALLARPVQSVSELRLLARILSGELVLKDGTELSRGAVSHGGVCEALALLYDITQDMWWGRAWTFQENYRGGQKMRLLIRHDQSLEQEKNHQMFDNIQGELCVFSVTFCTEATRLCLALRKSRALPEDDIRRIDGVLQAAGRYTTILPEATAMTSIVITDLEARGLSKPWDRLAIAANCCQYSVRLDGEALRYQRCSLSLSLLAMCLLNGEILDNRDSGQQSWGALTMSELLNRRLFRGFKAPVDESRRLTFYKGCRFTDVELTMNGILTGGHLWKLGRVVDTARFGRQLPWINNPNGRLTLCDRKHLLHLVLVLNDLGYETLAEEIDGYLVYDAKTNADDDNESFTEKYLHRMASELAEAIRTRQKLRLAALWDPMGRTEPYRAVFVWSGQRKDESDLQTSPAFVLTSAWFRDPGSKRNDSNDLDRHVSLQVHLESATSDSMAPRLYAQRWLLGMCFFRGCRRTQVIFPWPQHLRTV